MTRPNQAGEPVRPISKYAALRLSNEAVPIKLDEGRYLPFPMNRGTKP